MTTKKIIKLAENFLNGKIKEISIKELTPKEKAFFTGVDFAKKYLSK